MTIKFFKILLFLSSCFFAEIEPCGMCHNFAMGNLPANYRLVHVLPKELLKIILTEQPGDQPVGITYRNMTLLNKDELAEIIVDVGASAMYSQKFTGDIILSPFTVAVVAKQTLKVIAREKMVNAIAFATNKTIEASGVKIDDYPATALAAGVAKTAVRFGIDFCLDSAESFLIHKINNKK